MSITIHLNNAVFLLAQFVSEKKMASMEETITGLNKFVEDAFNKRDFEAIRAVYADDVRMMVPGRPVINGIDGRVRWFTIFVDVMKYFFF